MRFLKSSGLAFFLIVAFFAHAQDTVVTDTVLPSLPDTTYTMQGSDSVFLFDSVRPGSLAPFYERAIPDSVVQRLRSDDAFWYANFNFKKKKDPAPNNSSPLSLLRQSWFRNLLWAVIIVSFIVVLILFLAKSDIRLFHRKPAALQAAGNDALAQNIFTTDYKSEIGKAVAAGNFRLAIRLQYLQALRLLSDHNIIRYKEDFTNSDYLHQLRPTTYYGDFKKITRHFEYSWYGQFNVTADVYKTIETDFSTLQKSMGI